MLGETQSESDGGVGRMEDGEMEREQGELLREGECCGRRTRDRTLSRFHASTLRSVTRRQALDSWDSFTRRRPARLLTHHRLHLTRLELLLCVTPALHSSRAALRPQTIAPHLHTYRA